MTVRGFRRASQGKPNLKWEENQSTNGGTDSSFFEGQLNFVFDIYKRATSNLLFDPRTPVTAGIASPPIVNIV